MALWFDGLEHYLGFVLSELTVKQECPADFYISRCSKIRFFAFSCLLMR